MATIKIRELSVGDWVLMNGEPAKALRLTMAGRTIFKGLSGQIYGSVGGDIFPLPIASEILKANGWQRNEEDEYMEYYGDPTSCIAHTKGTCHYRLEAPEVSVVCDFVHQLQHALRLAGVDKEIIMP